MKQMIRIIVALGVAIGIALPPPTAAALPPVTHTNHTRHHAARPAFSEAFLFATVAPADAGSEGPLTSRCSSEMSGAWLPVALPTANTKYLLLAGRLCRPGASYLFATMP